MTPRRPPPLRPNPPWADQALSEAWDALERAVGAERLPTPVPAVGRPSFPELGVGDWGAVLATRQPNVVLKLTTDPHEARFAAWCAGLDGWTDGCVRYLDAVDLGPGSHPERPGAPVWALWREEAYSVGELIPDVDDLPAPQAQLLNGLTAWRRMAGYVRLGALTPGADLGAVFTNALSLLAYPLSALASAPLGYPVAAGLRWLLDRGVVLPDTHAGNVGLVARDGAFSAAITDASKAVFLWDPPPPMPRRVAPRRRAARA